MYKIIIYKLQNINWFKLESTFYETVEKSSLYSLLCETVSCLSHQTKTIMKNISFKILFESIPSQARPVSLDECVRSNFRKRPARGITTGNYEDHLDHRVASVAAVRTWTAWRSTRSVAWRNAGTRKLATPARWTLQGGCRYQRTCLGGSNRERSRDPRGTSGRRVSMTRLLRNGQRSRSHPCPARIDPPESRSRPSVDLSMPSGVTAPTWPPWRDRRRALPSSEGTRTAATRGPSPRGWPHIFHVRNALIGIVIEIRRRDWIR